MASYSTGRMIVSDEFLKQCETEAFLKFNPISTAFQSLSKLSAF